MGVESGGGGEGVSEMAFRSDLESSGRMEIGDVELDKSKREAIFEVSQEQSCQV